MPEPINPGQEYLTVKQAALYLGVSERTIHRLVRKGLCHLRLSDTVKGGIRFKKAWLDAWAEKHSIIR